VLDLTRDHLQPAPARPWAESTLQGSRHPERGSGGKPFRERPRWGQDRKQVDSWARLARLDRNEESCQLIGALNGFRGYGEVP